MKGRKPKPTEQKAREGNPGQRKLPEVVLVAGRPDLQTFAQPPAGLPQDCHEFWAEAVAKLVEVGIVDSVDKPALEILATCWARILQARRVLAEQGHYVQGSRGQFKRHPAIDIEQMYMSMWIKFAEHFAMTPIARSRLGLASLQGKLLAAEMRDALGEPEYRPLAS